MASITRQWSTVLNGLQTDEPQFRAELGKIIDLLAKIGLTLDVDLPCAPESVEVVDIERAEIDLERVEHLAHRHAHHLDPVAIDVEVEPRSIRPEAREDPDRDLRPRLRHRRHAVPKRRRAGQDRTANADLDPLSRGVANRRSPYQRH